MITSHSPGVAQQEPEGPAPLSVLITEILFDPDPVIGLPPCEYIELMNNSADTIDLYGFSLLVGSRSVNLPHFHLPPGSFITLVSANCAEGFQYPDIHILLLDKWVALRNSGQDLTLVSKTGGIMHFCTYHPLMFDDPLKADGGWSLELADINNPCSKAAWLPSRNFTGGTPGRPNSQVVNTEQEAPPRAVRAGLPDLNRLIIYFDKPLLPLSKPDWLSFVIEPEMKVLDWSYYNNQPHLIEISLDGFILPAMVFKLYVGGEACGCNGYEMLPGEINFGIPENPIQGDIVISEIMFDPAGSQAEFVEVCNLSGKVLALNELYLTTLNEDGEIKGFSKPTDESFLIFPGGYYVFTSDSHALNMMPGLSTAGCVSERPDFPSLPNTGSGICLLDRSQQVLDLAAYDPSWHDPRLINSKGVSLEKIRLDMDGASSSNWHSASLVTGGSSPGSQNSQQSLTLETEEIIHLNRHTFSPDRDGYDDCLLIDISPGEAGWIGTAGVWSLSGNKIADLMKSASLPARGILKWDGSDNNGQRASPGYYVIIINYIRPDGSKGRWKDACVVTGR